MANLKEVKSRMVSVTSTQQITRAMKMVAASKLRKAQDGIIQMRPYASKLAEILQNVSSGGSGTAKGFGEQRKVENVLLIPVTSDKGLCGPFNSNVIKATSQLINTEYSELAKKGQVHVMTVGKKALDSFRKNKNLKIIDAYTSLFTKLSFDQARLAAEFTMKGFEDGEFDKVVLIYNEFKNVATQFLQKEQLLPVVPTEAEGQKASQIDYIYEPSKAFIIEELIPKSLKIQFYKALLESNAGEHGARMTAMDKATENAGELLKELRLTYNRTRQAAITKEILEIVAGAEALSNS